MHLPLALEKKAAVPLQDQIFGQLRGLIVSGKLKPNSRIVASRFLADQVGISRTTVILAYDRLVAEGYLETRPAVGTFVSPCPPEATFRECSDRFAESILRQADVRPALFRCPPLPCRLPTPCRIDFRPGSHDPDLLPLKSWLRATQRILGNCRRIPVVPSPAGAEPLRRAIAEWLAARRGITVAPEQIIVTSGSRQSLTLIGRLFLRPRDTVVVETPTRTGAADLFEAMGARLLRVPVDEHGLDVDWLPGGAAVLAHITPSHQIPFGSTLAQHRRRPLIEWARTAGAYLIEDDCNGVIRYQGTAPTSLIALDPYGLVFHVGSFSQTLGDGVRLGYLIVPPEMTATAIAAKAVFDDGCSWFEQMVLADFIAGGEYDTHLRRLRKIWLQRRDCLIERIGEHFGTGRLVGTEAGNDLVWLLPPGLPPAAEIAERSARHGIGVGALSADTTCPNGLLFSYGGLDETLISEGVAGLAEILSSVRPHSVCASR